MATAVRKCQAAEVADLHGEQRVLLEGIGWEDYEAVLAMRGDRRFPRLAYFRGSLELMSPGHRHEKMSRRLGLLVNEIAVGLNIPIEWVGSMTLRRQDRDAGVEGDETFYLAHEPAVRDKDEIDLKVDPPPDLAVEVEITRPLADREAIYAALRVPELWVQRRAGRGKEVRVVVLHLDADGRYAEASASLSFPFLTAEEIDDWGRRRQDVPQLDWVRQVRAWVRDVLAPRQGGA